VIQKRYRAPHQSASGRLTPPKGESDSDQRLSDCQKEDHSPLEGESAERSDVGGGIDSDPDTGYSCLVPQHRISTKD